jgi:hypothetical protein
VSHHAWRWICLIGVNAFNVSHVARKPCCHAHSFFFTDKARGHSSCVTYCLSDKAITTQAVLVPLQATPRVVSQPLWRGYFLKWCAH